MRRPAKEGPGSKGSAAPAGSDGPRGAKGGSRGAGSGDSCVGLAVGSPSTVRARAPRGPTVPHGPPRSPCRHPPHRLHVRARRRPWPSRTSSRGVTAATPTLPICSHDKASETRLPGLGARVTHSLRSAEAPRGRQPKQGGLRFQGPNEPRGPPRPKPRGCPRARGQGLGDKAIQAVNTPLPRGLWPPRT